jgi:hypothetical protein
MTTTPGAIRSRNFDVKEDVDLMKCWLTISTDGIVGTNQSADQFWSRIWELMQAVGHSSRSKDSMQSRFKNVLNKEISKFSGYFIQVSSAPPTGTVFGDWVKLASALYNGVVSPSARDDCGPLFKHLEAWKVVKDHPKYSGGRASNFNELTPAQFQTAKFIGPEDNVGESNLTQAGLGDSEGATESTSGERSCASAPGPFPNDRFKRPAGTKATRAQRVADERINKKLRTLDALRETLETRNALKRAQLRMLLASDPETDAPIRAQLREEAIKELL